MNTHQNDEMPGQIRLRDLKNGTYQIHSKKHGAFEGPLNPIFWKAVNWGVSMKDLNYAVKELERSGHDYADFGILGGFLFTRKK